MTSHPPKTYSRALVEQLLDNIEVLANRNESLQRQLDVVDDVFIGTRHNWQGTGRGRVETIKELVEEVATNS